MRTLVTTLTGLQKCIEAIEQSSIICFDVETNGLRIHQDHNMIGIAFYCNFNKTSYYIPFAHGQGVFEKTTKTKVNAEKAELTNLRYFELDPQFVQLGTFEVFNALEGVLTPDKKYLCHNAQFDLTALWMNGIDLAGAVVYDTMLAARTIYSDFNRSYFKMPDTGLRERGNNTLKWLSRLFGLVRLDNGNVGSEQSLDEALKDLKARLGKNTLNLDKKRHMWALDPKDVAPYAMQDVELTYALSGILISQLHDWGQVDVYKMMCEHQTNVAWRMNKTGFLIDHERGQELMVAYYEELETLGKDIDFNINSANEVAAYATGLGVDLPKTPKDNFKTDKATLKAFQEQIPLLKNVLAIKALNKNVGTYIKKWLAATSPDEPIHPSFNVIGTVTGRWSSSDPIAGNLQNIPKDTKLKYSPKKLLLPTDPQKQIVEIDYSQLEIRVGAWIAETVVGGGVDMTLTDLIISGTDMHAYTRDQAGIPDILLGGRTVEEFMQVELKHDPYPDEQSLTDAFMSHARDVAKIPNFAAMYAGGWKALVDILEGISEHQARAIIDGWKEAYPTIVRAMTVLTKDAMEWRYNPSVKKIMDDVSPPPGVYVSLPLYQYIQYPDLVVPFIRKWSYYSESDKREKSKDAFNSIVQGTAGFITIESINRVLKKFNYLDTHATIHDSFVFSLFDHQKRDLPAIAEIMTDWDVYPSLEVDIEIAPQGKAWGYKSPV